MLGTIDPIDVDQHTGETFHDDGVFDRTRIPTGETGRFDKRQHFRARLFA